MTDALLMPRFLPALPRDRRRSTDFRIDITTDYPAVAERWRALAAGGAALGFQRDAWLASWYATLGRNADTLPLAVTVMDAADGRDLLALPLVRRRAGRLDIIEFADAGVTDYNAPILGPGAPRDGAGATDLWRALLASLPAADLLQFTKMPLEIAGAPNPLALLEPARPSGLSGNILHVEGQWNDWHWGLERTFRKELERSWRVFEKNPGARFERVRDPAEAARIFAGLKTLQSARIRELGLPYVLDERGNAAFYDEVLARGLAGGKTILTTLVCGGEIVGALLGIAAGRHYAMVRLAAAGGAWKTCSPGRLLIEQTMKALHAEGFRAFDFTIGDYAYKRRLGAASVPLCEITSALSWRGAPSAARARAKAAVKNSPRLMRAVTRMKSLI